MTALQITRERRKITQAELARRSGLARSTVSKLESGASAGTLETWLALGFALAVDYRKILPPAPRRWQPRPR